jgi:hypothetical protein
VPFPVPNSPGGSTGTRPATARRTTGASAPAPQPGPVGIEPTASVVLPHPAAAQTIVAPLPFLAMHCQSPVHPPIKESPVLQPPQTRLTLSTDQLVVGRKPLPTGSHLDNERHGMRTTARTRRFCRAALLAIALLPCLGNGTLAAPCPTPPRDWSQKTLDAFAAGGAIWKLNNPSIDPDTLAAALRSAYNTIYHSRQVPEPTFLDRFHSPADERYKDTFDYQAQKAYRQDDVLGAMSISDNPKAGWSWGPNPTHNSYDLYRFQDDRSIKSAKCRSDGLVLIGYYKPDLPDRSSADFNRLRADTKYLVSIMDLTQNHLPWLLKMREQAMAWLGETYDVDPWNDGDTVRMYFHWPTGHPTSTLHLHVRVNWRMSPVEYIHSYTLDDIIETLQGGRSVARMIADRYIRMGGVIVDGTYKAMTSSDESSDLLINRYLQSVMDGPRRLFREAVPLPKEVFGSVKDVVRTALAINGLYYIQLASGTEKKDNSVRAFRNVNPSSTFNPGVPKVFDAADVQKLGLSRSTPRSFQALLSCLLPYFDGVNATDCVKIVESQENIEVRR